MTQPQSPASPEDADGGFDAIMARLREVVAQLEAGQLSLEQALSRYEEGVSLARRGHQVLDRAEKRVEALVAGEDRVVEISTERDLPE